MSSLEPVNVVAIFSPLNFLGYVWLRLLIFASYVTTHPSGDCHVPYLQVWKSLLFSGVCVDRIEDVLLQIIPTYAEILSVKNEFRFP